MRTRWLDETERDAWRGLALMTRQLDAVLARQLAGSGLSLQDYGVLAHLSDQPDGRARMSELGRSLGWEKSRVSHHVGRMEARRLVARERCPSDRRGWFVVITPTGHRAIAAAAPGHVESVRQHFVDLLDRAQLSQLTAITATVLDHLAAHDGP